MSNTTPQSVLSDCRKYVKSRIKFNTFNTFNNVATALLLSSAFGDMENPLVVISVIIATASTLVFGLVLVKDKKEKKGE